MIKKTKTKLESLKYISKIILSTIKFRIKVWWHKNFK